jgi:hypothetical protein
MVVSWAQNLVKKIPDGADEYSPDDDDLSQSLDDLLGGDESIPTTEVDGFFDALDNPNAYFEASIP